MKPHITLITLGVDDLERSLAFYRALGLESHGITGTEFDIGAVAFFDLQPGLKLAVWPRTSLAKDTGLTLAPAGSTNMCLAHNVGSTQEVDNVMQQAQSAGATIVKSAQKAFWGGYSGYFQDPDGHLWEVAFNPELPGA
jgi:catechol 2,3-dioxygenase-like lactoylglutathione lyase family enzyme